MKRIYKEFLFIISFLITLSSCDYKSKALGSDRRIFVFVDTLIWNDIQDDVEDAFHSYVYTPRAEKSFSVEWKPLSTLAGFKDRKNIIFIGTTNSKNEVNDYINQIVPSQFIMDVNNDKGFYFFKDDLFVGEQINLFMIAKDTESFLHNFKNLKDDIFERFNNKYFTRLEEGMFEKGEQFNLEDFLKKEYGYSVKIQHDYFIANQEPEIKYVWIRRINPDRWISIWRVNIEDIELSKENIFSIRNGMAKAFYEGDYIVEEETSIDDQFFLGRETKKVTGIWRNDSLLIGGPFRTYLVPKEDENSVYFIDIAVMAPALNKKPYLDQLEVIARSFEFENKDNHKN